MSPSRRYFRLRGDRGTFRAQILGDAGDPRIRILVGGPRRTCVFLDVYKGDPHGTITSIGIGSDCIEEGNMSRGAGTVDMLRTSLAFAQKMLPVAIGIPAPTHFLFVDGSRIECKGRPSVALWAVSLLVHGKTWYERWFDARPHREIDREALGRLRLEMTDHKLLCPWRDIEPHLNAEDVVRVRDVYGWAKAKGESMHAFVRALYTQTHRVKGTDERCNVLRGWTERWVEKRYNTQMDWEIDGSLVDEMLSVLDVTEVPAPPSKSASPRSDSSKEDLFHASIAALIRRPSVDGGGGVVAKGPWDPWGFEDGPQP